MGSVDGRPRMSSCEGSAPKILASFDLEGVVLVGEVTAEEDQD